VKPIIGLLAEVSDEKKCAVLNSYVRAIEDAGGLPVLLPYVEDGEVIADFCKACDGILFTGGVDVDPGMYGEKRHPMLGETARYRDSLEARVFSEFYKTEKPILGICRGAQIINVLLGGSLWQDIPSEMPSEIDHRQKEGQFSLSHRVNILEGTPLRGLVSKGRMNANSFHHQAIKALGADLEVMARADDGVIEAVYSTKKSYLRAYQWHPERIYGIDGDNRRIFVDFVTAAARKVT